MPSANEDKGPSFVSGFEGAMVKQRVRGVVGMAKGAGAFPGSHPVSLSRLNIETLLANVGGYVVGHKLDGERRLLFVDKRKGVFLLDRKMGLRRIEVVESGDEEVDNSSGWEAWSGTLLDGELVTLREHEGDEGREPASKRIKTNVRSKKLDEVIEEKEGEKGDGVESDDVAFVVLDVLSVRGENVMKRSYPERMKAGGSFIDFLKTRSVCESLVLWQGVTRSSVLSFSLHHFLPARDVASVLRQREEPDVVGRRGVRYSTPKDGLVFQPIGEGYSVGYSKLIFKWKTPMENTIDFHLKRNNEEDEENQEREKKRGSENEKNEEGEGEDCYQMYVMGNNNRLTFWDYLVLEPNYKEGTLEVEEGRIAECYWDANMERWRLLKLRRDKNTPNAEWVANQIWQGIEAGLLEEEELVSILSNHEPYRNTARDQGSTHWQQHRQHKGKRRRDN
mgnify:CR=1 FL=1